MIQPATVMGFGTFDGLHPGHLSCLSQLKSLGNFLIVVVARDESVKRLKGKWPKRSEQERLEALRQAPQVDEAIFGDPADFHRCIRERQPQIIGLGYDQKADVERLKAEFPEIQIVRLEAYGPEKYKSSLLDRA